MGREERIAARRQRIKEKLGAQKGEGAGGDGDGSKEDEETRSQAQISDSRARINKLKSNGALEVTKVRIVGDSRENERRINEEVNRQGRRQKLLYEAESSARQNAAVAMKWSALFDKEIPQELFAEIELQRDSCERIIQAKDRLIKEFKAELKAKDDEYVKALKRQSDDVELLLERMTRQFTNLRRTFDDELEEIETAFMQERAELMSANKEELYALMKKRGVHGGSPPARGRGPAAARGAARAGPRGLQHPQDQARDRGRHARAAARGDESNVPAQPGETRLQLPSARRTRLGEHEHDQAAEEAADAHGGPALDAQGALRARGAPLQAGER